MKRTLEVSKILFMGDVISSYCKDGTLLENKNPSDIKLLKVYHDSISDEFWSNDNSSLYILKKSNIKFIPCEIKNLEDCCEEFYSLFRNKNHGQSIKVLQNQGKWEQQYESYRRLNPNFKMSLDEFIEYKKKKKEIPLKEIDFSQEFDLSINNLLIKENQIISLPVNKIYFLQEYISSIFHDGSSIFTKNAKDIDHLEILFDEDENKFYSINNRSLYVLKSNKVKNIKCHIKLKSNHPDFFDRKSLNYDGKKIKVRHPLYLSNKPYLSNINEVTANERISYEPIIQPKKIATGTFLETFSQKYSEATTINLMNKKRNRDETSYKDKISSLIKRRLLGLNEDLSLGLNDDLGFDY